MQELFLLGAQLLLRPAQLLAPLLIQLADLLADQKVLLLLPQHLLVADALVDPGAQRLLKVPLHLLELQLLHFQGLFEALQLVVLFLGWWKRRTGLAAVHSRWFGDKFFCTERWTNFHDHLFRSNPDKIKESIFIVSCFCPNYTTRKVGKKQNFGKFWIFVRLFILVFIPCCRLTSRVRIYIFCFMFVKNF